MAIIFEKGMGNLTIGRTEQKIPLIIKLSIFEPFLWFCLFFKPLLECMLALHEPGIGTKK